MNRNQTWTLGGVESGILVRDVLVPLSSEEIAKLARLERLRTFPTQPQTLGSVLAVLSDLIRHLGLDV